MSTWNYRLMRHVHQHPDVDEEEVILKIHEVYYRDRDVDDTRVSRDEISYTANPVSVTGETVEEVRAALHRMLEALDKPVIDYE